MKVLVHKAHAFVNGAEVFRVHPGSQLQTLPDKVGNWPAFKRVVESGAIQVFAEPQPSKKADESHSEDAAAVSGETPNDSASVADDETTAVFAEPQPSKKADESHSEDAAAVSGETPNDSASVADDETTAVFAEPQPSKKASKK